jgi:hypothetical protein
VIKSGGSKPKSTLSEFQLQVDKEATVVYIDPPDTTAAKGETFRTRVMLSNPGGRRFDEVRLALRYDRDVVRPVSYTDRALRRFLAEPSRLEVHPRQGILVYTARLVSPFGSVTDPLFSIQWEATELSKRAEFQFARYGDRANGLWLGKKDILGDENTPGDGFINGSAQIIPLDLLERLQQAGTRRSASDAVDEIDLGLAGGETGGVALRLRGPNKPIRVGDWFDVDIILDNSADSLLDRVDVYLNYDSEVLEVVDHDENNFMTRGVNIYDGPYHHQFPFDYHIDNSVYEGRGQIVYRMGITDPEKLRHREGPIATVRFRAIAPAPSTTLSFRVAEQSFAPGTRVSYLGESVLGDEEAGRTGLEGLRFRVLN